VLTRTPHFVTVVFYFFFSSRRRHTRSKRDWSSDVCSSDLYQYVVDKEEREIEFVDFSGMSMEEAEKTMRKWTAVPFKLEDSPMRSEERRVGKERRCRRGRERRRRERGEPEARRSSGRGSCA